jgi:hypothetical protein
VVGVGGTGPPSRSVSAGEPKPVPVGAGVTPGVTPPLSVLPVPPTGAGVVYAGRS